MSWLKSTISKVRESSEALKQNQTLKNLKEKTTSAVAGAGDAVQKLKLGRITKASDLEAQLEQRARAAKTPQAVAELHRSWLQQVTGKDGYSAEEGEREISFKEVLLRSRALEITVEVIASEPSLRMLYTEPPAPDDKASPVACLYMLFSKTLACPVGLWSEVLKLAMAEDGLLCESHSTWIVGVVGAMKADAHEEALYGERKDLALRAERLRQEIKELEAPDASGGESQDDRHKRRLAASTDLLRTYEAVRRNLEDAQTHRQDALASRQREISLIAEQIQAYIVGLQSSVLTSGERQKHLEGELKQSQDSIQMQVQNMGDARNSIDQELEELEKRKQALKMELEEVTKTLEDARQRQRDHMGNSDRQRSEVDEIKRGFKEKIEAEETQSRDATKEQGVVERCQQLVKETDSVVQKSLGGQLEELKVKQGQFNDHFKEVMKEHLSHEEEHAKRLKRRAEESFSNVELQPQVVADAEAASAAFLVFRDSYREMLVSADEVELVERLAAEHAAIRQLLLPGIPPPEQGASASTVDAVPVSGANASTVQATGPQAPATSSLPAAPVPSAAPQAAPTVATSLPAQAAPTAPAALTAPVAAAAPAAPAAPVAGVAATLAASSAPAAAAVAPAPPAQHVAPAAAVAPAAPAAPSTPAAPAGTQVPSPSVAPTVMVAPVSPAAPAAPVAATPPAVATAPSFVASPQVPAPAVAAVPAAPAPAVVAAPVAAAAVAAASEPAAPPASVVPQAPPPPAGAPAVAAAQVPQPSQGYPAQVPAAPQTFAQTQPVAPAPPAPLPPAAPSA